MSGLFKDVDSFVEMLKRYSNKVDIKDNEIVSYCVNCEKDSTKNHGHMYISLNEPLFNCYKCGEKNSFKGYIGKLFKFLEEDISQYIDSEYVSKIDYNLFVGKKNIIDVNIKEFVEDHTGNKIRYINSRTNDCDISKIPNIIVDVKKFLNTYKEVITKNNKYGMWELVEKYSDTFIGFISNNKEIVIFRDTDINSGCMFKHMKLKLNNDSSYYKDCYYIQTNQVKTKNLLVLSEGVFDILNVMTNKNLLSNIKSRSCAWSACLGKGYMRTIESMHDNLKILKSDIIILSDSDVEIETYKNIKYMNSVNTCNVLYNKDGKDFGECKSESSIVSTKIK